jgi:hypothetical protein
VHEFNKRDGWVIVGDTSLECLARGREELVYFFSQGRVPNFLIVVENGVKVSGMKGL